MQFQQDTTKTHDKSWSSSCDNQLTEAIHPKFNDTLQIKEQTKIDEHCLSTWSCLPVNAFIKIKALTTKHEGVVAVCPHFYHHVSAKTSLSTSMILLPSYLVQGGHSMTVIHKFRLAGNQTHTHVYMHTHTCTHTHPPTCTLEMQ